jgi:hypothetical protein
MLGDPSRSSVEVEASLPAQGGVRDLVTIGLHRQVIGECHSGVLTLLFVFADLEFLESSMSSLIGLRWYFSARGTDGILGTVVADGPMCDGSWNG